MGSFVSKPQEPVAVSTAQEPVRDNGKQNSSGKRKRSDDNNDEEELRGHLTKKPRLDPDSVAQEQSENIPRQTEEKSGKRKRSEDDEEISAPRTKKPSPYPIEEDREISPPMSDFFEGPENPYDDDSAPESEASEGTLVADQEEQDTGPIQEEKDASIRRYAKGVDTIRTLRLLTFDNPREAAQNEANIERECIRILAEKEWYEGLDAGDFEDELCDIVHKALRSSRCVENSGCQERHHDPSDCKHKLKDELYAEISAACKKERKRPKYSFPRI